MKSFNRRKFIKSSSLVALAGSTGVLASCTKKETKINTPNINFNKIYNWKMVTTWPPNFPVLGEGCNLFAKWVKDMSGGRMNIEVY